MNSTARIATIFRREFAAYFTSPLAGIFLVIYLFMSAVLTFQMGGLHAPLGGRPAHRHY